MNPVKDLVLHDVVNLAERKISERLGYSLGYRYSTIPTSAFRVQMLVYNASVHLQNEVFGLTLELIRRGSNGS